MPDERWPDARDDDVATRAGCEMRLLPSESVLQVSTRGCTIPRAYFMYRHVWHAKLIWNLTWKNDKFRLLVLCCSDPGKENDVASENERVRGCEGSPRSGR